MDATGNEQDWEFEFADKEILPLIFDNLYKNSELSLDEKTALSLLAIASLEGCDVENFLSFNDVGKFKKFLLSNPLIFKRMKFYWVDFSKMDNVFFEKQTV